MKLFILYTKGCSEISTSFLSLLMSFNGHDGLDESSIKSLKLRSLKYETSMYSDLGDSTAIFISLNMWIFGNL